MAVNVKDFKSKQFQWLVSNADSDPKLKQLLQDLENAWGPYLRVRAELDYLYTLATHKIHSSTENDLPWA